MIVENRCPQCGTEHPDLPTLRAEIEKKDAEMKRMAVELEALKQRRVRCDENGYWIALGVVECFQLVDDALDALMAEREE